jgi:hypothetical protein
VLDELEDCPDQQENVKEALMTLSHDDFSNRLFSFLRCDEEGDDEVVMENTVSHPDPELEAKLEELRASSQELGEEFDEEATRALLTMT